MPFNYDSHHASARSGPSIGRDSIHGSGFVELRANTNVSQIFASVTATCALVTLSPQHDRVP